MTLPAIEVRDLRKRFRKRTGLLKSKVTEEWALGGVSFEVARGETYGLLGPNGSGKSTLIRILSTLLIADGGEVRLLGHRLPEEHERVRAMIGRVSVDAAFYKKLSARENLLYTALLYGLKPAAGRGARHARCWNSSAWRNESSPPARRDEPRDAAEDLHRTRADGQPAAAASRRADDRP